MAIISPSLLSADFSQLGQELKKVEEAGADWLHFDVMDGHFVPNITFGPQVVSSLRDKTSMVFDVHLMIEQADQYLKIFAEAGADIITVSAEACVHLHRTLQIIRSLGKRAGVALNPATSLSVIEHVLEETDLLLLMSVNPGFGGQEFIPASLRKIEKAKAMIGDLPVKVSVDGGINVGNAPAVLAAGADVLVAGTAVFGAGNPSHAIKMLQTEKKMV